MKASVRSHKIRCAIYTRKSTEEGLEQAFNSLDAQYEACQSYIASQRHEGWHLIKSRYDDGGISGGTMERPGLQMLLRDVEAGRVDMIVVYKIDRLTRSLMDFSKIIERLDRGKASFVSVTQSFNTATSMGRLTLNMLLSFAQFEREVTAERIRDKIAASKAKGLWMGGTLPLGYKPHPDKTVRGLLIDIEQADKVRKLFCLYETLQCLTKVERAARQQGIYKYKKHPSVKMATTDGIAITDRSNRTGSTQTNATDHPSQDRLDPQMGNPQNRQAPIPDNTSAQILYLSRGAIYNILTNPIYIGKIRHKTLLYDGRHDPIIDLELWQSVQDKLKAGSMRKREGGKKNEDREQNPSPAPKLLRSKLYDETGDRLTPTYTIKANKIIGYYISNRLTKGKVHEGKDPKDKDPKAWRLAAKSFEPIVMAAYRDKLRHVITPIIHSPSFISRTSTLSIDGINTHMQALDDYLAKPDEELVTAIQRIDLKPGTMTITIDTLILQKALHLDLKSPTPLILTIPMILKRRGVEQKLIIGKALPERDQILITALAKAHYWLAKVKKGETFTDIATQEKVTASYIRARIPLAFLSPKIQKAITTGTHDIGLSLERLIRNKIPLQWKQQEQFFLTSNNNGLN